MVKVKKRIKNSEEYEKERYLRQSDFNGWDESTQQKLKDSTVFIAGAGGLASPVALYLAAAGVGTLRICDPDRVELSNLNRQIMHSELSIGTAKVLSAKKRIKEFNSLVNIEILKKQIKESNISSLIKEADLIIDCVDNFETRFVLNAFAVKSGIPLIHAGIQGMSGQITFIHPPETPCLNCVFPQLTPQKAPPIIGAAVGVVGSLEALEAIKYLTGSGELLKNRLLVVDGFTNGFDVLAVEKNPRCPVCGKV